MKAAGLCPQTAGKNRILALCKKKFITRQGSRETSQKSGLTFLQRLVISIGTFPQQRNETHESVRESQS